MTAINTTEIELTAAQAMSLRAALNDTIAGLQVGARFFIDEDGAVRRTEDGAANLVHMRCMSAAICSALLMIGGRRPGSAFGMDWRPAAGLLSRRGGVLAVPDGYVAEVLNNVLGLAWQYAVCRIGEAVADGEAETERAAEAKKVLRHVMQRL